MKKGVFKRTGALVLAASLAISMAQVPVYGATTKDKAETLYLTENAVRSHAKHLYTKLDVHSKQELMNLVDA